MMEQRIVVREALILEGIVYGPVMEVPPPASYRRLGHEVDLSARTGAR